MGKDNYENTSGKLVAIYHPQCKYSQAIVDDFLKVAQGIHDNKAGIEVIGVNMSKTKDEYQSALEVKSYPTIRFYKSPSESFEMD